MVLVCVCRSQGVDFQLHISTIAALSYGYVTNTLTSTVSV